VQSVPNAAYTNMLFDVQMERLTGLTGSLKTDYAPGIPGWYSARATASFAANATGLRYVAIRVDGATVNGGEISVPALASGPTTLANNPYTFLLSTPTNRVSIGIYQSSGAALNTQVGVSRCSFSLDYVGPIVP
jgi:hypothetical protein